MKFIKTKLKSSKGDPNSASMVIWISIAVVVVLILASLIIPAITEKAGDIADEVNCTGSLFGGSCD
ncbi:MAG: hypothetical protein FWD44_02120 [Oscillospiraceae bacterium]|nr:hypothetical protein [Oscillospiraceae bacterium]